MINDDNLNKYAQDISKLTFDMQKICNTKEVFFCKSINLTPIESRCMRYLLDTTFLQVKELAKNMGLTPSRITNLLNSLEQKGYIMRKISTQDRRIIKVALTEEGEKFAIDINNKYIQFHKDILSSVSSETKLEDMLSNLKSFQHTLEIFLKNRKNI
jgi:DNA-binding MarR family transcriptional regulator